MTESTFMVLEDLVLFEITRLIRRKILVGRSFFVSRKTGCFEKAADAKDRKQMKGVRENMQVSQGKRIHRPPPVKGKELLKRFVRQDEKHS